MTYDQHLENERELYESREADCYKIYLVAVKGKIIFDSEDYDEAYNYYLEESASLSANNSAVEFGYVLDTNFNPRDLKETYRLIENENI